MRCEGHNCLRKETCRCYTERNTARTGTPTVPRWPFPYPEGKLPPQDCNEYDSTEQQQGELPL